MGFKKRVGKKKVHEDTQTVCVVMFGSSAQARLTLKAHSNFFGLLFIIIRTEGKVTWCSRFCLRSDRLLYIYILSKRTT